MCGCAVSSFTHALRLAKGAWLANDGSSSAHRRVDEKVFGAERRIIYKILRVQPLAQSHFDLTEARALQLAFKTLFNIIPIILHGFDREDVRLIYITSMPNAAPLPYVAWGITNIQKLPLEQPSQTAYARRPMPVLIAIVIVLLYARASTDASSEEDRSSCGHPTTSRALSDTAPTAASPSRQ